MSKDNSNPFIKRYPPNCRFTLGGFKEQVEYELHKDNFGESVVDKESYRLHLAGKRGSIVSLAGIAQKGFYMFPDGKYDHDKDFSYFYRKDLSIVEIDDYIARMKKELEKSDKALAKEIQAQIEAAEAAKNDLNKPTDDSSPSE